MIVYNQAFDYYHAIYRMIKLLANYKLDNFIEVDRLRIWDYYLLFPQEIHSIRLKREEKDIRAILKQFIKAKNNPYNLVFDNKKVFEKLRPYQLTALNSLASYGIIDIELLKQNRIEILSKDLLMEYSHKFSDSTPSEKNVIAIMTSHFAILSMFGADGLKNRTQLMESKYDS